MAKTKKTSIGTSPKYKEFLDNIELYALGLESLSANLKREEYFYALTEKSEAVVREIKTNLTVSEFDEDHFDVIASFTLLMKIGDNDAILSIDTSFSAHFHPREGSFHRRDAEQFANAEARLIFWPYFRQTVADVTARMHIRPITIPLVLSP